MVKTIPMTKSDYYRYLKKQEVTGKPIVDKLGKINKFYLPLSKWINSVYNKDGKTKLIGLSGGQGAGKSTITGILKLILKKKTVLPIFGLYQKIKKNPELLIGMKSTDQN